MLHLHGDALIHPPTFEQYFGNVIILEYYDGAVWGIARTSEGVTRWFDLLDWDEVQDDRLFRCIIVESKVFDHVVEYLSSFDKPRWPYWPFTVPPDIGNKDTGGWRAFLPERFPTCHIVLWRRTPDEVYELEKIDAELCEEGEFMKYVPAAPDALERVRLPKIDGID